VRQSPIGGVSSSERVPRVRRRGEAAPLASGARAWKPLESASCQTRAATLLARVASHLFSLDGASWEWGNGGAVFAFRESGSPKRDSRSIRSRETQASGQDSGVTPPKRVPRAFAARVAEPRRARRSPLTAPFLS
jgi:hypothetical protein